ncbi:hypothetical protein COO60DRAFT_1700230 [Scenedesmus sp. NREL 46B-D3]|nr:hypothetical protein COO60DRAFT_1700230 [Scenedesmus sp. NREL 46B-D3]
MLALLAETPGGAARHLADLQARGANLAPLLKLLLPSLAAALPQHPQLQPLLTELLHGVELDAAGAQAAAMQLLQAGAAGKQQHLQQVLQVLDLRYPEQLDAAINAALQQAAAAGSGDAAAGKKGDKKKKTKSQQDIDANSLFEFVQQCFSGSRHEVVPPSQQQDAAGQQQQQALTLSLAVSAPATAAGLAGVPGEQQLPGLQYLLARAADALSGSTKPVAAVAADTNSNSAGGKAVLKAAKAALAAVAAVGQRAAAADDAANAADSSQAAGVLQQQAAALLLEYALADKRLRKLARAAVSECCSAGWHPLLQAVASAPSVAAELADSSTREAAEAAAPTSDSKRQKKGSDADAATAAADGKHAAAVTLNRAVVQALAEALCSSDSSSSTGTALLEAVAAVANACGPRCLHLLLLAMLKTAIAAPAPAKLSRRVRRSSTQVPRGVVSSGRIAVALLHMLERQLAQQDSTLNTPRRTSSSSLPLPEDWAATAADVLDADGLPNLQHLQQLHKQLPQLQAALLLSGLRAALQAAGSDSLTELLGQPVQLFSRLAAAAAAAGAAGSGLHEHLQLLVLKSCHQPQQQLAFLSGVYGLPAGCCPEAAQVAALQLLDRQAGDSAAWGASGADASGSSSWLLLSLAAAGSSSKRVRGAAVDALLSLPDAAAAGGSSWRLVGGFTAQHLSELVTAIQPHAELLRNSSGSMVQLLCSAAAAAGGAGAGAMDVDSAAGSSRGRSSRGRDSIAKAAAAGAGALGEDGAEMHLPASCAAALQQLLLQALPQLHGEADLLAAELAVAVLAAGSSDAAGPAAAAACELLRCLLSGLCSNAHTASSARSSGKQKPMWQQLAGMLGSADAVGDASKQLQQLRAAAAAAVLRFVSPEAVAADRAGVGGSFIRLLQLPFVEAAAAGLQAAPSCSSSSKLTDAQLAAVAPARAAALQQLDAALFAALDEEQQQAAFTAALQTHASDGDASCRAAARAALELIPITAGMVLQLLQHIGSASNSSVDSRPQQQQSRAKRSKRSSSAAGGQQDAMDVDTAATAATGRVLAADLDAAVAALELLQWKEDVADKQQLLLQPLQSLLQRLTPLMGSIAEIHLEEDAVADATGGKQQRLALATLEQLAKESDAAAAAIDASLVLSCASAAPDGAVRNAALLLLAVLSQQSPEDVLGHVLQALAVIQHSAAFQEDAHSQAVASAALTSLVPAWLAAGRDPGQLWGSLLGALPGLPAPRRLRLLEALRKALPEDAGLPVGLLLVMQRLVAATTPAAAAALPEGKTPKKGKKQPAAAAVPDVAPAAAAAPEEAEWLPDLMAALCEQVAVPQRLQAFAAVLAASLASSPAGQPLPAHSPLPRLAVTFVTANLKAKSVLSAAQAAPPAVPELDAANPAAAAAAAPIPAACHAIMTQALLHLQQLNPASPAAASHSGKTARKQQKAIRAAAAGVYELLAALEAVQDCGSYLRALVQMSRHAAGAVQRRALKLLASRLLKAAVDLADLGAATARLPAAEKQAALQQLAAAGLAVCGELPTLLAADAPLTRQLALIAADAGIRQFGQLAPGAVLSCLGAVVGAVGDAAAAVRVSALACVAAGVAAVGPKLVPLLPQTAAAVLAAAQAACKDLEAAGFDQQRQQGGSGSQDASEDEAAEQQQGGAAADDDDDAEAAAGALSKGEEAALQLAGCLAALEALVAGLGAFMSPYLKQLLQLLLHKQVLACSTAGGAEAAARLRAALPACIPPRLLLEPLASQWDYAVAQSSSSSSNDDAGAAGASAAAALLELVQQLCSSMEPSVAMTYHEQLLALLLRALDTRHKWLAATAGQQQPAAAGATDGPEAAAAAAAVAAFGHAEVHAVEAAAVAALAALVMKLSESKFKPLFLRIVDWASAGSSGSAAGDSSSSHAQAQGRAAAFLAAVCVLSHRLRSVFAPYHRYFSTMLMKHLAGEPLWGAAGGDGGEKRPKRSTGSQGQPRQQQLSPPTGASPAAAQEQQERFDRLLPLAVEVLAEGPPASIAAVVAAEGADSALDAPGGAVAALGAAGKAAADAGGAAALQQHCDAVGCAAVGALLQMATTGGSDVYWKPLHHAVLMVTRGGGVRAKLLGLGAVSRLAELLREEYLMLLPEALPFVAELMEDGEVAVEGAAQGLVAQLEALSGERLEQYLKA